MTKFSKKSQTKQSCKTGVSGSNFTDKLIFFYDAFKKKRNIETQIFNDVFCEYEDKFHKNNKYKTAMTDFKKWLKIAVENRGYLIKTHNATQFNGVHRMRIVWVVDYCH